MRYKSTKRNFPAASWEQSGSSDGIKLYFALIDTVQPEVRGLIDRLQSICETLSNFIDHDYLESFEFDEEVDGSENSVYDSDYSDDYDDLWHGGKGALWDKTSDEGSNSVTWGRRRSLALTKKALGIELRKSRIQAEHILEVIDETESSFQQQPIITSEASRGESGKSYVNTLPAEILFEIIKYAQQSDPNIAFTMAEVDSFFNRVIMAEGSLWSNIDIGYGQTRTLLLLERCQDSRLNVSMPFCSKWPLPPFLADVRWFLEKLTPLTERIQSLSITGIEHEAEGSANVETAVHFLFENDFPVLESITLGLLNTHCVEPRDEISVIQEPDTQFTILWPLKKVSLSHVMPSAQTRFISDSTTHLEICEVDLPTDRLVHMLSQTPNLEHLRLVDVYDVVKVRAPGAPMISLGSLTTLALLWSSCSWLGAMNYVETPALCSVEFQTREYSDGLEHAGTCLLDIVQSNPQLLEVSTRGLALNSDNWSRILGYLPNVTHLRIASSCLKNEDLSPLAEGRRGVCPSLTNLTLQNEIGVTSEPIVAMAIHRNSGQRGDFATLRYVALQGFDGDKIREKDFDTLSKLVLNLKVETFDGDDIGSDREESEYSSDASGVSDFDEHGSTGAGVPSALIVAYHWANPSA